MADTNVDNSDLLQGLNVLVKLLPQPGDAETNPLSFAILAAKLKGILDLYTSSRTKDHELRACLDALCLDIKAAIRAQPILANLKAIKTALNVVEDVNFVDEESGRSRGADDNVEDELESHETDDEDDVPFGDLIVDGSYKALVSVGNDGVDKDKSAKPVPGPVKARTSPRKSANKTAAAVLIPIKTESKPLSASQPTQRRAGGARVSVKTEPVGERPMKSLPKDAEGCHSLPIMLKAEYAQRIGIEDPALAEYAKNQPDTIKCKHCRDKQEACIIDAMLPKTACLFCKHSHTPKCTIQKDPRPNHQTEPLRLKEMDPVRLAQYLLYGQPDRPVRAKRKYGEDRDPIIDVKRSKKAFDNPSHSPRGGATTLPKSKASKVSGKSDKTRDTRELLSVRDPTHITSSQRFEAFFGRMTDTILDLRNGILNMARAEREEGRREGREQVRRDYSGKSASAGVEEDVGDTDNEEMEAKLAKSHGKRRRD